MSAAWPKRMEYVVTSLSIRCYSVFYIVTRKRKRKVLHSFYTVEWKAKGHSEHPTLLRSLFSLSVLGVVADFAMRSLSGRVLRLAGID